MSQAELNVDTTPEWVIFGWARGERGAVRVAFVEGPEEPGPKRIAEAKVAVTQHYRQVYYGGSRWSKDAKGEDDWPTPNVSTRDESKLQRRTFA